MRDEARWRRRLLTLHGAMRGYVLAMFSGAAQADTGQDGNETMARGYEIFHNIAFDTPPAPGNRGAVPIEFPVSSFDLDLEAMRKTNEDLAWVERVEESGQ